jgi:hypothetical protein
LTSSCVKDPIELGSIFFEPKLFILCLEESSENSNHRIDSIIVYHIWFSLPMDWSLHVTSLAIAQGVIIPPSAVSLSLSISYSNLPY